MIHVSRRVFLAGTGGAAACAAVAACGGGGKTAANTYTGDTRLVALAAALENQAVAVYTAALDAAKGGRLGTVPAAFTSFAQTAIQQHAAHAKAWNALLSAAHKTPVTDTPLAGPSLLDQANGASTFAALGGVALHLENQAAQTHLAALGALTGTDAVSTAAGIGPVEAMHAAVLGLMLGQSPVPADFLTVDGAVKTSALQL